MNRGKIVQAVGARTGTPQAEQTFPARGTAGGAKRTARRRERCTNQSQMQRSGGSRTRGGKRGTRWGVSPLGEGAPQARRPQGANRRGMPRGRAGCGAQGATREERAPAPSKGRAGGKTNEEPIQYRDASDAAPPATAGAAVPPRIVRGRYPQLATVTLR